MLALLQFTAPALLAGLAAAALPVLIHLLLRPRPRHVRFPAVAFLHAALASGQRAQRLRNLWLLLVRMLLVACVALLLAGPTCVPTTEAPSVHDPGACVLVVDDSWSMQYRLDGDTTMLDQARLAALDFLSAAADWPQPSALGLVWADPDRPSTELTADHATLRTLLREPTAARPHASPLSHALREATRQLRAARQPTRRLVVFTDQAAHAWRDVTPGLLTGIDNLTVSVRSVAPARRSNLAITASSGPAGLQPETAPVPLQATLTATGFDASCTLVVRDADRILRRVGPLTVSADSSRDIALALPPYSRGAHALTVELEPGDRLDFDQRRHVVFETAERPEAWLVTPTGAGPDVDLTALLLRNLLAPETLEPERQLVSFRHVLPAELGVGLEAGSDGDGAEPDLIVITSGVDLNETARQAVRRAAERGAIVLLLPGSRADAIEWPGLRRLLARAAVRVEALDAVTSFSWEASSEFAGGGEVLDELTRAAVRRRVVLANVQDGVTVEARYADGVPAIVSLRSGKGRLLLLTTSPDPEWSELGVRAAGLLTWLHDLLRAAGGEAGAVATFSAGQVARKSFAGLPGRGNVRVVPGGGADSTPIAVRLVNGEPVNGWPTEQPGFYSIRTSRPDAGELLYAVNWPAEESDPRPITAESLAGLLGVREVELRGSRLAEAEVRPSLLYRFTGLRDAADVLPFILLGLMFSELWLALRRRHARASV